MVSPTAQPTSCPACACSPLVGQNTFIEKDVDGPDVISTHLGVAAKSIAQRRDPNLISSSRLLASLRETKAAKPEPAFDTHLAVRLED